MNDSKVKKINTSQKTTVLELDIILDQVEQKDVEKVLVKQEQIKTPISNSVVKKAKSVSAKQRSNLKSLFANVKTSAKKVSKEKVLNIKQSSIASRFKSKFEKDKESTKIDTKKLQNDTLKDKVKQSNLTVQDSIKEEDPYYSKIYSLISSKWRPTIFHNELSARVVITINSNGEFSYKFIQYSNNMGFDSQLKRFLDSQLSSIYPINPNRDITQIEILFQSKGE